jgi:hypothetical protein
MTAACCTFGLIAAEYITNLEATGSAPSTIKKNRRFLEDLAQAVCQPPDCRYHRRRALQSFEAHREERRR